MESKIIRRVQQVMNILPSFSPCPSSSLPLTTTDTKGSAWDNEQKKSKIMVADSAADFKKAALVVGDCGRVKFFDELRFRSVQVSSGSVLDLNGKTLVVNSAKVNGVKLASGTYTAESTVEIGEGTLANYLVDTADGAGGSLVVTGGGLSIIVR